MEMQNIHDNQNNLEKKKKMEASTWLEDLL